MSAEENIPTPEAAEDDPSKPWEHSAGNKPYRVTARERFDKNGVVYVRYTIVDADGIAHRKNEPLGTISTIRNKNGERVDARTAKAAAAVEKMSATLLSTNRRRVRIEDDSAEDVALPSKVHAPSTGQAPSSMTLRKGLDLWLDDATVRTRDRDDARAHADEICRHLGALTRVESLRRRDVKRLWVSMYASWEPDKSNGRGGPVLAQRVVSRLFTCIEWLLDNDYVGGGTIRFWPGWRKALQKDWAQLIEKEGHQAKRLAAQRSLGTDGKFKVRRQRFEYWQLGRLLLAAYSGVADPRISTLVVLGAELRMEVVSRSMRSQLLMPNEYDRVAELRYDDEVTPARLWEVAPYGIMRVYGVGNKLGGTVVLTQQQGEYMRGALECGYLRELELAYRRGDIANYPLICGAKLTNVGETDFRDAYIRFASRRGATGFRPIVRRCIPPHLTDLEDKAGVPHVAGRGLRGMRRIAADIASELDASNWVKDELGFWSTRERVYKGDYAKLLDMRKVADFREQVRARSIAEAVAHDEEVAAGAPE